MNQGTHWQKCKSFVLKYIEKMTNTLPDEPDIETVTKNDAEKTKILEKRAELKFKSKYDQWLTRTERIEKKN